MLNNWHLCIDNWEEEPLYEAGVTIAITLKINLLLGRRKYENNLFIMCYALSRGRGSMTDNNMDPITPPRNHRVYGVE
jgi:hypothetical protein